MGKPALPDLDPLVVAGDVDLEAPERVRMAARLGSPPSAREQCVGEDLEHLVQLGLADCPFRNTVAVKGKNSAVPLLGAS